MPVSMVAVEGRAVVMVVSRWPISVVVAVLLVSKSARGCVLCAKKFALLGPVRTRARKSSPSVLRKAKNWRFMACWASFFAQMTLEGSRWASFFAEIRLEGACWANVVVPLASLACPATTGEPGQARRPQPGRSGPRVIAANEPPAHASCGGGRQHKECLGLKQQQAMHSLHTTLRS